MAGHQRRRQWRCLAVFRILARRSHEWSGRIRVPARRSPAAERITSRLRPARGGQSSRSPSGLVYSVRHRQLQPVGQSIGRWNAGQFRLSDRVRHPGEQPRCGHATLRRQHQPGRAVGRVDRAELHHRSHGRRRGDRPRGSERLGRRRTPRRRCDQPEPDCVPSGTDRLPLDRQHHPVHGHREQRPGGLQGRGPRRPSIRDLDLELRQRADHEDDGPGRWDWVVPVRPRPG